MAFIPPLAANAGCRYYSLSTSQQQSQGGRKKDANADEEVCLVEDRHNLNPGFCPASSSALCRSRVLPPASLCPALELFVAWHSPLPSNTAETLLLSTQR
eukprot:scaffold5735_cov154-Skeletonema_menzelii.AAC.2